MKIEKQSMKIRKQLPHYPVKRRWLIVCFCLVALTSIQCKQSNDWPETHASTVTILYGGDEWLMGPADNWYPQHLMFLTLAAVNERAALEGRLAERWEHSPDYRTWTFYLRRDIRWHDGVPFTAHDVKFSLELFAHPDVLSINNDLWRNMSSFTVLDEFTFTISYTQPSNTLEAEDALFYPRHLLKDLDPRDFYQWDFWLHPIGNGPFRYVRHVPKTMFELEANPDFFLGKPKIERVIFKLSGGAPLTELRSGNVDVVLNINPADIPKLDTDDRFRIYQTSNSYWLCSIHWNNNHPLFIDPLVRRALTLAINRRELVQMQKFPVNTPIVDGIFTDRQAARGELPDPLQYDPGQAGQLLEAAGWHDRDGDGIRERNGEEARFTALVTAEEMTKSAIYVQAQLRRVGIQMEVQPLAFATLRARLRGGDFDAAFDWFENWPRKMLQNKWFESGSPIGYANPQIVKLLEDAVNTIDPERMDRIYHDLTNIFREELPMTFLYTRVSTHIAHRRLRGLETKWPNPVTAMENLWLVED